MAASNQSSGSILDLIYEKTANVESSTVAKDVKESIKEFLASQAKRERAIRDSTIAVKHSEHWGHTELIAEVDAWIEKMEQLPPTYWQDKELSYCQFNHKDFKVSFLDHVNQHGSQQLKDNLLRANSFGRHFSRKPARIEMANVKHNIKLERIKELLELASTIGDPITEIREGKPHAVTKARSILFKAGASNMTQLFGVLDGALPYNNKATKTRTRIQMKINVKPWQCHDCFAFGQHQCEGKKCLQCGEKGHTTKDCRTKTKTCANCRKKGHKAKDAQCPQYLREITKEIRKIDLPLEFYEDKKQRDQLLGCLQYK